MKKIMGMWDIVLMNILAILGLRWLPIAAGYGAASIALWILAALIFFIPLGLIATELATAWPEEGGLYVWVKEAFGEKTGFLVSWFYWINSFFYFPSLLIFVAVLSGSLFSPTLASNKLFICSVVLFSIWFTILMNLRSTSNLKGIANVTGIIGTIFPVIIIITLGFAAIFIWKQPIPTSYTWSHWIPHFGSKSNITFFSTLMFSMAGIELTPILAGETKNPKKTFPRALFISAIAIVSIYIIGTISITFMAAPEKIGAASGIVDALKMITTQLNIPFLASIVTAMIIVSSFGGGCVWVVVPIKMFIESCKKGMLPKFFTKLNKNGSPSNALLIVGVIFSLITIPTLLLPSVNVFYEIVVLMTTITFLIPYIIMFMAFHKLRSKFPEQVRPYRVPGGKPVSWILTIVGIGAVLSGIVLPVIVPPNDLHSAHAILMYRIELVGGPVFFALLGYFIYRRYERKHRILVRIDD